MEEQKKGAIKSCLGPPSGVVPGLLKFGFKQLSFPCFCSCWNTERWTWLKFAFKWKWLEVKDPCLEKWEYPFFWKGGECYHTLLRCHGAEICLEILATATARRVVPGIWKWLWTMNGSLQTLHQEQLLVMPPATIACFQSRTPNSTSSVRQLSSSFQRQ